MKFKLFIIFVFFVCFKTYSQKLSTNANGQVFDENNKQLKTEEVQKLLENYPKQLAIYNSGNSKKNIRNICLLSGFGLIGTDLIISLANDTQFPKILSAIGAGAVLAAIPIKLGYTNKIQTAVNDYNNDKKVGYKTKFDLFVNPLSIGIKLTFN